MANVNTVARHRDRKPQPDMAQSLHPKQRHNAAIVNRDHLAHQDRLETTAKPVPMERTARMDKMDAMDKYSRVQSRANHASFARPDRLVPKAHPARKDHADRKDKPGRQARMATRERQDSKDRLDCKDQLARPDRKAQLAHQAV